MVIAVGFGAANGQIHEVANAVTQGSREGFELLIAISGVTIFWAGMMQIVRDSGMANIMEDALTPILRLLFPEVPKHHPAMSAMALFFSASALGLSNATLPLGIAAMQALATLQAPDQRDRASDAMCMLITISASNIQLIPASAMGFLAMYGCHHPTLLMLPAMAATACSTLAGILSVWIAQRLRRV